TGVGNVGDAFIRRALVNSDALVIRVEIGIGPGEFGDVGAVRVVIGNPATDPSAVVGLPVGTVEHHFFVIIAGIHLPGQLQLFEVVETGDPLRFHFCLGQGGQQHGGEDGDDGDDDE